MSWFLKNGFTPLKKRSRALGASRLSTRWLLTGKPGANKKKESYAKALITKPPSSATGNLPSRVRVKNSSHGTRVFFKKPSQFTSGIICNSSGQVQSQVRQGSDLRRSPSTQSSNFKIIWGTRFSTKEPEIQQVLSALEDPQSISVNLPVTLMHTSHAQGHQKCA